jgi:hypothetical protein
MAASVNISIMTVTLESVYLVTRSYGQGIENGQNYMQV